MPQKHYELHLSFVFDQIVYPVRSLPVVTRSLHGPRQCTVTSVSSRVSCAHQISAPSDNLLRVSFVCAKSWPFCKHPPTRSMMHYTVQRQLQSKRKFWKLDERSNSPVPPSCRLTPSPELSPPALRQMQGENVKENRTASPSNLVELYNNSDIARAEDLEEGSEGKSVDDGLERLEDSSQAVPPCFEESTSHIIAIAASFPASEFDRTGEDEDEDLVAVCTLAEGPQTGSGPVSSSGQVQHVGAAGPHTGEAGIDASQKKQEGNQGTTTPHRGQNEVKKQTSENKIDCRLSSKAPGRILHAEATTGNHADGQGRVSSLDIKWSNARSVAAVRRRSLLTGCISVVGVGLLALACVSPWNVEIGSFYIVAGSCICILGCLMTRRRSQLLLTIYAVLLACFLVVLASSILLNFHWAVQSFRALRHAYFDDFVAQEEAPGSRTSPQHISQLSTPLRVLASDEDTLMSQSVSSTVLPYSALALPNAKVTTGEEEQVPAVSLRSASPVSLPLSQPIQRSKTMDMLERQAPGEGYREVKNGLLMHRDAQSNLYRSHFLQGGGNKFYGEGLPHKQQEAGNFTRCDSGIDRVRTETVTSEFAGNIIDTPLISQYGNKSEPFQKAFQSVPLITKVAQASGIPKVAGQTRVSEKSPLLLNKSPFLSHFQRLLASAWETRTSPAQARETRADNAHVPPPTVTKAEEHNFSRPSPLHVKESIFSQDALQGKRRNGKNAQAFRQWLHKEQSRNSTQTRDTSTKGRTVMFSAVTFRTVSPFVSAETNLRSAQSTSSGKVAMVDYNRVHLGTPPVSGSPTSGSQHLFGGTSHARSSEARSTSREDEIRIQLNKFPVMSYGTSRPLVSTPTALFVSNEVKKNTAGEIQGTDLQLKEGIVNPEPARCNNMRDGLLKYVHSTRRQLETYGLLCAFSRYDMWGFFDRWLLDCENRCGFRYLATKRFLWSGAAGNAASTFVLQGGEIDLPLRQMSPHYRVQKGATESPLWRRSGENEPSTGSLVSTKASNARSASDAYPTMEYLQWHASLPLAEQKACLEGALNVACSVVESHYLMLLPAITVLLLLTSSILLGIGISAMKSIYRLERLDAM